MFLTKRQLRALTGIPSTQPAEQLAYLNERGIRNFGINAAGNLVVPCSAIEGSIPSRQDPPPSGWVRDLSRV